MWHDKPSIPHYFYIPHFCIGGTRKQGRVTDLKQFNAVVSTQCPNHAYAKDARIHGH